MADQPDAQPSGLGPVKLKLLKQTHPKFDIGRAHLLHALYRGGCHLLDDSQVMGAVFPRYSHEADGTYAERKRRAFYENVFASVINQMSAGLAQDPIRLQLVDGEAPPDDYWIEIVKNAAAPNLPHRSLDQIMRDFCIEALVCGHSWLQCEMPKAGVADNLKQQEDEGLLRAYLCQWSTTHVLDWEEDEDGQLLWIRARSTNRRAQSPTTPRDSITHCWTIWDRNRWTRYEVVESKEKPMPNDEELVQVAAEGEHSFKCVPWIHMDVCGKHGRPSLHLGDHLESLCRAHFNVWNGEMFALTQTNFQQLYEFLAPEVAGVDTPISEAQSDPSRAMRGRRSPGAVHVRGEGDRAEFVAPNMSGAAAVKQAVDDLRDAIYRVTQQMALSQDTSGAMLKRSADSKKQDAVAQEIVLGAIGKLLLSATRQTVEMLCAGRGDDPDSIPEIAAYESFDVTDVDDLIQQSVTVETVDIPSARYQIEQKYRLAVAHLGDSTDETIRMEIRKQLESAITQDQIEYKPPMFDPNGKPIDQDGNSKDDDTEDEEDPDQEPFK